jgi:ABC-type enterochelin transport system substrate-binding protein
MKHLSKNDLTRFLNSVENKLQTINIEYAGKRKSLRLKPMGLKVLDKKSLDKFKSWRVSQGIREAQFKTVPLTSDKKMISPLSVLEEIEIN